MFEEGPLRKFLRGRGRRSSPDIPVLFGATLNRVESAIAEEKEAIDDYAELENQLRNVGQNVEAEIVNEIRNDEMDHRVKFEAMLRRLQTEAKLGRRV